MYFLLNKKSTSKYSLFHNVFKTISKFYSSFSKHFARKWCRDLNIAYHLHLWCYEWRLFLKALPSCMPYGFKSFPFTIPISYISLDTLKLTEWLFQNGHSYDLPNCIDVIEFFWCCVFVCLICLDLFDLILSTVMWVPYRCPMGPPVCWWPGSYCRHSGRVYV